MGTRLFCDNCGNTVQQFIVFYFGRMPETQHYLANTSQHAQAYQLAAMQHNNGYVYSGQTGFATIGGGVGCAQTSAYDAPEFHRVELCEHCAPGWISRVKKLTQQSDV